MSAVNIVAASFADQLVGPGLLLALVLLAAVAGGYAARWMRLPQVVGYLAAGLLLRYAVVGVLGPSESGVHPQELPSGAAQALQPIKTLALGLILFSIGGVFEKGHFKMVGPRVLRISLAEVAAVVLLVAAGCTIAGLMDGSDGGRYAIASGVLLGVVAIATAPAATLMVLREYDAKGPVSDTILTLTALNNAACIILFHAAFLIISTFGLIDSGRAAGGLLWLDLLLTTAGSAVLGIGLGFLLSVLYSKAAAAEFTLILIAVILALGVGSRYLADTIHLSYSFLLTCLFIGAVFANITVDQDRLHESLRPLSAPIFAAFFVLAGYELHLGDAGLFGLVGVCYVVFRSVGKYLGGYLGARWAGSIGETPPHVGLGLLCQAGVAIGLADFLVDSWGTVEAGGYVASAGALRLKTVIVGSVVLFELAGPLVLKRVVVRSGEVKAITLLRRHRLPTVAGASTTRLAWDALLRSVGLGRPIPGSAAGPLQVRHIMRSNIKFLRASSSLDEVLHFVETSRYNDFPVADDDGRLVGMIHFSELRKIIYDPILRRLVTAMDLVDPDTPAVPVDSSLDQLLEEFHRTDTGLLPVVKAGGSRKIVGLVEQRDLLRALHRTEQPKNGSV